ncbi:isoprenylcysteine carboxyl methyltransferase [Microdochium bolleyi]|uniref:Protein-S-isoprenylcysteine O-methyltransferase n=1 Tax=Microdochium bolleyi TaxID=196109 RepID=A0A136JC56_9PEZI|nr:isoprenylcysteine carboxyl methyltransferase [Microdochium bolleyi]
MDSDSDSPAPSGPQTTALLEQQYLPRGKKSLSGIATRSFCLGMTLAASVMALLWLLLFTTSPLWRLPFFFAALSVFHFLEFYTTAAYSTRDATVKSFLLTANWPAYAIAHASASVECLVTNTLLFPPSRYPTTAASSSWLPSSLASYTSQVLLLAGVSLVILGQTIRSAAMVEAGPSFNHVVQHRKRDSHVLVTTGVYGHLRHPSYFGFFWWAVGTQLVLGNVVCLVAYVAVLWTFFSSRVKVEEAALVRFFGREYEDYKTRVGTKMPFIG